MSMVGQWERRCAALVDELSARDDIMHVDDLPALVHTGRTSQSATNVAGYLEPHITRGELRVLGECTPERWAMARDEAPGFAAGFRVVRVPEMTERETLGVLVATARAMEGRADVQVDAEVLPDLLALTRRFYGRQCNPGRSVALLERTLADHREIELDDAGMRKLTRAQLFDYWQRETGLPSFVLWQRAALRHGQIESHFGQRIIGQAVASAALAETVTVLQQGLDDPDKPLATMLFVGPTGVGKTESAKALAEYVFGSADRLLRFDMSEFRDAWSASRLFGDRHRPDGDLTRLVRQSPFSVILLDEIEKADSSVFDAFLQVFGEGRVELNAADVMTAFSRAGGFPKHLIDSDRRLDLDELRAHFSQQIIGQPEAVELCVRLVALVKASLNDPARPMASYLFMGPTGVGKTETASCLAAYLFGDRARMIRLDMSEYGHPGAAMRLVSGEGGEGDLTKRVREQPFSLILLDEIEKAAPEVFDVLLQVLGEGRLTDATGSTVRFDRCIVIMTSNLGAGDGPGLGLAPKGASEQPQRRYVAAAEGFFKPEFVNRIDYLVSFSALSRASVRQIALRMLDGAAGREGFARRSIELSYDAGVIEMLVDAGFDERYGARPLKRAIDTRVLAPLARRLSGRGGSLAAEKLELYVFHDELHWQSDAALSEFIVPRVFDAAALESCGQRLRAWHESAALARDRRQGEGQLSKLLEQLLLRHSELTVRLTGGGEAECTELWNVFVGALASFEVQVVP